MNDILTVLHENQWSVFRLPEESWQIIVRALGCHLGLSPAWGATPRAQVSGSRALLYSDTSSICVAIGLLGGQVLVFGSRGRLHGTIGVRCYHLPVDNLRQLCSEKGMDISGPVRLLRQGVADHVKGNPMNAFSGAGITQTSAPTDLLQNVAVPNSGFCSHGGGRDGPTPVLVELLGQVSPLCSEDPEAILRFSVGERKYRIWDWWTIGLSSLEYCPYSWVVC
jgi:hypothetical protein